MPVPRGVLAVLLPTAIAAWWVELRTPRRIRWRDTEHAGLRAQVAEGLVLQHVQGSVVWGTLGYSVYRSDDGGDLRRVARIRPPWGEGWGGYSRTLRRVYGYQELVELLPLDSGRVVMFAAGWVHVVDLESGRARRTHQLRYFGRGKGRGLMAFGLTRDLSGALYFAEYVTESGDRPTGAWKSTDDGETWRLCYEFGPTDVRHIHALQCDPHDGALWIATGDRDEHCFVGRSIDGAASFEWVGHGRQTHRTCSFAFFDDAVVWGTDADFEQNHVVRWTRASGRVTVRGELPDATYYAARIDDEQTLLGVCQGVAQVWVAGSEGSTAKWLDWTVPGAPAKRGPSPGVRLARGEQRTGAYVYVNPLRTAAYEAAIFRIDRSSVPAG